MHVLFVNDGGDLIGFRAENGIDFRSLSEFWTMKIRLTVNIFEFRSPQFLKLGIFFDLLFYIYQIFRVIKLMLLQLQEAIATISVLGRLRQNDLLR